MSMQKCLSVDDSALRNVPETLPVVEMLNAISGPEGAKERQMVEAAWFKGYMQFYRELQMDFMRCVGSISTDKADLDIGFDCMAKIANGWRPSYIVFENYVMVQVDVRTQLTKKKLRTVFILAEQMHWAARILADRGASLQELAAHEVPERRNQMESADNKDLKRDNLEMFGVKADVSDAKMVATVLVGANTTSGVDAAEVQRLEEKKRKDFEAAKAKGAFEATAGLYQYAFKEKMKQVPQAVGTALSEAWTATSHWFLYTKDIVRTPIIDDNTKKQVISDGKPLWKETESERRRTFADYVSMLMVVVMLIGVIRKFVLVYKDAVKRKKEALTDSAKQTLGKVYDWVLLGIMVPSVAVLGIDVTKTFSDFGGFISMIRFMSGTVLGALGDVFENPDAINAGLDAAGRIFPERVRFNQSDNKDDIVIESDNSDDTDDGKSVDSETDAILQVQFMCGVDEKAMEVANNEARVYTSQTAAWTREDAKKLSDDTKGFGKFGSNPSRYALQSMWREMVLRMEITAPFESMSAQAIWLCYYITRGRNVMLKRLNNCRDHPANDTSALMHEALVHDWNKIEEMSKKASDETRRQVDALQMDLKRSGAISGRVHDEMARLRGEIKKQPYVSMAVGAVVLVALAALGVGLGIKFSRSGKKDRKDTKKSVSSPPVVEKAAPVKSAKVSEGPKPKNYVGTKYDPTVAVAFKIGRRVKRKIRAGKKVFIKNNGGDWVGYDINADRKLTIDDVDDNAIITRICRHCGAEEEIAKGSIWRGKCQDCAHKWDDDDKDGESCQLLITREGKLSTVDLVKQSIEYKHACGRAELHEKLIGFAGYQQHCKNLGLCLLGGCCASDKCTLKHDCPYGLKCRYGDKCYNLHRNKDVAQRFAVTGVPERLQEQIYAKERRSAEYAAAGHRLDIKAKPFVWPAAKSNLDYKHTMQEEAKLVQELKNQLANVDLDSKILRTENESLMKQCRELIKMKAEALLGGHQFINPQCVGLVRSEYGSLDAQFVAKSDGLRCVFATHVLYDQKGNNRTTNYLEIVGHHGEKVRIDASYVVDCTEGVTDKGVIDVSYVDLEHSGNAKLFIHQRTIKLREVTQADVGKPVAIYTVDKGGQHRSAVGQIIRLDKMLVHNVPTVNGNCSASLVDNDGRLIGIHVQTDGIMNYAVPMTKGLIAQLSKN